MSSQQKQLHLTPAAMIDLATVATLNQRVVTLMRDHGIHADAAISMVVAEEAAQFIDETAPHTHCHVQLYQLRGGYVTVWRVSENAAAVDVYDPAEYMSAAVGFDQRTLDWDTRQQ